MDRYALERANEAMGHKSSSAELTEIFIVILGMIVILVALKSCM